MVRLNKKWENPSNADFYILDQVDTLKMDKKPLFTKAFIHEPTIVVQEEAKQEEEKKEEPTQIVQKNKGRCFSCRVKVRRKDWCKQKDTKQVMIDPAR